MRTQDISEDELIDKYLPKEKKQDALLITASLAFLTGLITLISSSQSFSAIVVVFLIISIISFCVSIFLLFWYNPRLSLRTEKWKDFLEKRVNKMKKDAEQYAQLYESPLFREKLARKIREHAPKIAGSKKENFRLIIDRASQEATSEINKDYKKRKEFFANLMYKSFMTDLYFSEEKIYKEPLDEKWSRVKLRADIFAWKARYHFFVIGSISMVFAIVLHLLLARSVV